MSSQAALRLQTGHDPSSFRMLHLVNRPFSSPFFVAVDTESDTTVIAVRGTMSLSDVLTDAVAGKGSECVVSDQLIAVGRADLCVRAPCGRCARSGRRWIRAQGHVANSFNAGQSPRSSTALSWCRYRSDSGPVDAYELGPLRTCFLASALTWQPQQAPEPGLSTPLGVANHDRRVVVVGHSLGAGVATLLAILLKVCCYAL